MNELQSKTMQRGIDFSIYYTGGARQMPVYQLIQSRCEVVN